MVSPAPALFGRRQVDVPSSAFTDYRAVVGDPLFSAAVAVTRGRRFGLTLTGAVKVPVTDTTSFGTGEWDAGVSLSSTGRFGDRMLLGLDLGVWYLGDLPGLDLRNPVSGTISANRLIGGGWGLMAFASGSTAPIRGFDPPATIGGGLTRVTDNGGWGVQVGAGLTETSADLSVATFWRVGL
jgi:hypothetical protein